MKSIEQLAEEWLHLDKDPETRREIVELLASKNDRELEKRLRHRITFGTAGLRSRMQAGFARMNSLTVVQASQGLAHYLLEQLPDARQKGVVIGRDARHNSDKFAELAAAAFLANGIKVWWLERIVHTPLVPFAVRKLNAAAGIVITASHNPAQDNGYKVYWSNGCQIIPPHDTGIAAAILGNVPPASWDIEMVKGGHKLLEHTLDRLENDYFAAVKHLVQFDNSELVPHFVYTPMHGVGLHYMLQALKQVLGPPPHDSPPHSKYISPCTVVAEQANPDPDFPTVQFPNPEETGALALAMRTADAHSTTLILATDPDADRLAVAEKLPNGAWHQFTGNQLGVLLASSVLESPSGLGETTVISSPCSAPRSPRACSAKWPPSKASTSSRRSRVSNGSGTLRSGSPRKKATMCHSPSKKPSATCSRTSCTTKTESPPRWCFLLPQQSG